MYVYILIYTYIHIHITNHNNDDIITIISSSSSTITIPVRRPLRQHLCAGWAAGMSFPFCRLCQSYISKGI